MEKWQQELSNKGNEMAVVKNKPCMRMNVNFSRYPELWELIVNNARDNCRSLNSEIIHCIQEQYEFEHEVKEWEEKV